LNKEEPASSEQTPQMMWGQYFSDNKDVIQKMNGK
jgi:hypothetical protein